MRGLRRRGHSHVAAPLAQQLRQGLGLQRVVFDAQHPLACQRAVVNDGVRQPQARRCRRQRQAEATALAGLGCHTQVQGQQVAQALDDGQAQAMPTARVAARVADLVELLEDPRQLVGGDADTAVLHVHAQGPPQRPHPQHHMAAFGVAQGIGQQVAQHAAQVVFVTAHPQPSRRFQAQIKALGAGLRLVQRHQALQQRRQWQRADAHVQLAGVDVRQRHQLVDDVAHLPHTVHQLAADTAHVGVARLCVQGLGQQRQGLQRLAQVVAGSGQETHLGVVGRGRLAALSHQFLHRRKLPLADQQRVHADEGRHEGQQDIQALALGLRQPDVAHHQRRQNQHDEDHQRRVEHGQVHGSTHGHGAQRDMQQGLGHRVLRRHQQQAGAAPQRAMQARQAAGADQARAQVVRRGGAAQVPAAVRDATGGDQQEHGQPRRPALRGQHRGVAQRHDDRADAGQHRHRRHHGDEVVQQLGVDAVDPTRQGRGGSCGRRGGYGGRMHDGIIGPLAAGRLVGWL